MAFPIRFSFSGEYKTSHSNLELVLKLDKYTKGEGPSPVAREYILKAHNNLWSNFKAEGTRQALDTICKMYETYLPLLKSQVSSEKYEELLKDEKEKKEERVEVLECLLFYHRQREEILGAPKSTGGGRASGRKGGRSGGRAGGRAGGRLKSKGF